MDDPRDRLTLEGARKLVTDLTADLGVQSARVESRPRLEAEPAGLAQVDVESRVIFVEPGDDGRVAHPLLIFHEVAHLLEPHLPEPHGPEFARAFLDLVDRYQHSSATYSHELRVCFRVYGVDVLQGAGSWARPDGGVDTALMTELEQVAAGLVVVEVAARKAFMVEHNLGIRCRELEFGYD
jgi:hypothetical protein